MFNKILIVCVGNICRSPTAEFMLQAALPSKQVDSAGLHAMVDKDMDGQARQTAESKGLVCKTHSARQLTSELGRNYDLILVMEKRHRDEIAERFPELMAKTMLLGKWEGEKDIPDPYRKSDEVFEQIYHHIETSVQSWATKL